MRANSVPETFEFLENLGGSRIRLFFFFFLLSAFRILEIREFWDTEVRDRSSSLRGIVGDVFLF